MLIQRSPYSNLPRFPNGNKKRERERERGEQKSPCPVVWLASVRLTSLDVRCSVHEPITRLSLSTGMLNTQPMFHAVQLQIQLPRAPWTDFFTLYGTHLKLQLSYHHFQFQWPTLDDMNKFMLACKWICDISMLHGGKSSSYI